MLSLCFDDFPASAWTEGGPVLDRYGVKATYYVCAGLCGGHRLGVAQFEVAHLGALTGAGHELGAHTFDHENVLDLTEEQLDRTVTRNARWVAERLGGYRMRAFAFPFGYVSTRAKRLIARRFETGRGVVHGLNVGPADLAGLKAIGLEMRRFPRYDLEAMVRAAAARRGWLIAYGHDVSDRPTPYGCRPRDLERLIVMARTAGLEIRPVTEAAGWIAAEGARAPPA